MIMTDEQYIEKLLDEDVSQSEINQLLKIYVYTKRHDFILQTNDEIDTEVLRNIAKFLKKEELSENYYSILNLGQEYQCDIVPYLLEKYDENCLRSLISMEIEKLDTTNLKNPKFSARQLELIREYIEDGIAGINEHCANPEFSIEKIKKIALGLTYHIILEKYIDIDKFSFSQCEAISDILCAHEKNPDLDINLILNPSFSPRRMAQIAKLMVSKKDYKLLLNEEISDELCNALYKLITNNCDLRLAQEILFSDKKYNSKQLDVILKILTNKTFDIDNYDYKKIFDPKNNYYKILLYNTLVKNNEIEFLNKIIDKDYKAEQIIELYNLHKMGINIDEIRNVDNIKELHLLRRKKELAPFNKTPEDYIQDKQIFTVQPKEQKYKIQDDYYNNQYLLTNDNCLLEIYRADEYSKEIFGEVYDDKPDLENEFMLFKDDIIEVFRNRFILTVDEESETIDLYDIFEEQVIQVEVDHVFENSYFANYLLCDDKVYSDMFDAVLEYYYIYDMMSDLDTPFEPPIEEIEDFMRYIPNFSDTLKVHVFGDMSETLYYTVRKDDIIEKYGYLDEETSILADKEFAEICEYLDASEDCEIFTCKKYDLKSNLIKEGVGYYGQSIIENIEKDFGEITSDLGLHKNINSAINFLKKQREEER